MEAFEEPWHAAHPTWRADLQAHVLDPTTALPVPADTEAWLGIATAHAPRLSGLLETAHAELTLPWPTLPATLLARLHRDGDRDAYEQVLFERQHRLTRATLAAALTAGTTDDAADALLDSVADGVLALCEQSTWCWPAHDDARTRRGWVLPDPGAPYLDLGAGEVAAQLAWLDAILGDRLDGRWPGLRERMRREVETRVITPFLERRDWHWLGLDGDVHNWNPWIHGNVLVAALQLLAARDPRRTGVLELCVEGIDRYLAALPPDGAIDEGYGYWWNGACRAIEALDVLRHATGGALDAADVPVLRATVSFPRSCHLGGDWFLNHADGQARSTAAMPWHALDRAARWLDDPLSASFARSRRDTAGPHSPLSPDTAGLGRYVRALADPAWAAGAWNDDDATPAPSPHRVTTWWPSTQVLTMPPVPGGRVGLTVKGGHNGEHHNHLDVGSVIVDVDGVPVLVDAGRPTYTAATFGPDRYDEWCLTSPWHCTPTVAGITQGVGARYGARDVVVLDTEAGPRGLELELSGAYPGVTGSWLRRAWLAEDASVHVRDAWDLTSSAGPGSDIHYLLAGTVRLGAGEWIEIDPIESAGPARGVVRLSWTSSHPVRATLERRELTDPLHRDVWGDHLTRLTLSSGAVVGWLDVVVDLAEPTTRRVDDDAAGATPVSSSGMMQRAPSPAPRQRQSTSTPQEHP
ncbi:heparinase II/III domain-containing protein [Salana multivorans]